MTADHRPSRLSYWGALTLAIAAIVADAASTQFALRNPDAIEGDPVAAWLFAHVGGIWPTAAIMSSVLLLCAWIGWRSPRRGMASLCVVIFWIAIVLRIVVVTSNVHHGVI